MAIIYSYPTVTPESGDLIIGTDITGKVTKNFTVGSIIDLVEKPDNVNGTVNTIPVFTDAKTIGNSIITQDSGANGVGIGGDAENNRKLKVHGNSSVDGNLYLSGDASDYSIEVGQSRTTEGVALLDLTGEIIPDDYGLRLIRYGGENAESAIIHTGTSNLRIRTENSADTVFENTKVGIGTTTPGSKLDVNGDVTVSGNIDVSGEIIQTSTGNENSFSSELNMNSNKINSLADPTTDQDAATKAYVDAGDASQVTGTGTTQTLPLWSEGPNGVLGDSAIKQHNGNNITIGAFPSDTSEGSYTLSVGNDNDFTSGTARVLAVGADNVGTSVDVVDSAVIGLSNEANSSYSLTVGQRNQTNSGTSFVAGVDNVTSSGVPRQFVIGRDNTVDSIDTIVLGDRNIVAETGDGFGSMMVFGHLNNVLGDRIVCLGTSNIANSDNQGAYIIGAGNSSTADRTYSVGQQNAITGNESYAFGKSNTIVGSASAAVGTNNSLNASEKAYAFGFGNDNINLKSFAIGEKNDVLDKKRTYLIGRENKPATDNTIILGQFSDPTVLRSDNPNGRSTVAFGVGVNNETRRTAWEFRGKPTSAGDTSAGDSMQIMAWALLYSSSYTDDTAAAAGGVEVGQLYRTGSTVKIRMT